MGRLGDELAKVLFRKRRAYRYTQADLGTKIGVSGSYVSALEAARTSPRLSELEDLSAIFRTTAVDLILEAARADEAIVPVQPAGPDRASLDALAEDLSADQRSFVRDLLLFLRERERADAAERGP